MPIFCAYIDPDTPNIGAEKLRILSDLSYFNICFGTQMNRLIETVLFCLILYFGDCALLSRILQHVYMSVFSDYLIDYNNFRIMSEILFPLTLPCTLMLPRPAERSLLTNCIMIWKNIFNAPHREKNKNHNKLKPYFSIQNENLFFECII